MSDYKTADKTEWFIQKMRLGWFSRQEIVELAKREFPNVSPKVLNGTIGQYWSDSVEPKWATWKAIQRRGLRTVTADSRRCIVQESDNSSSQATKDNVPTVVVPPTEPACVEPQDAALSGPTAAFQEQERNANARKLLTHLEGLADFEFAKALDYGDYKHMGATITASILQAGLTWETTVKPRVDQLIVEFPEANTTTGFLKLLEREGYSKILRWTDDEKPNRILRLTRFFQVEGVETEVALRKWLLCDKNAKRLLGLRGVGEKTVDFLKILVRIQTNAVDRHLNELLANAGIKAKTYQEAHDVIDCAADLRGIDRILLDFSIWRHMSEKAKRRDKRKRRCRS